MGKVDADIWAKNHDYETTEELQLRDGSIVYLLQPKDGAVIGLPRYIKKTPFGFDVSTDDESMNLFNEPDYMRE